MRISNCGDNTWHLATVRKCGTCSEEFPPVRHLYYGCYGKVWVGLGMGGHLCFSVDGEEVYVWRCRDVGLTFLRTWVIRRESRVRVSLLHSTFVN